MGLVQSELELEKALVEQLSGKSDGNDGLGYELVRLPDEAAMLRNLRQQLEIHNDIVKQPFSDDEFKRVLDFLCHGNTVFERAERLRDRYQLTREDGTVKSIRFINQADWCLNEFQVTHQVTSHSAKQNSRKTRFDVTLLINGLPLVQIELKRRGVELKEAYNQIDRYHRDSYWNGHGLYLFTQMYVISNGVNTKYFANNHQASFDFTFFWADKENRIYSDLHEFSSHFLRPCHVAKMITHYTVLHQSDKCLMLFRPYQFYAAEALIERAKTTQKHAYIWHTTGSGKTLTSFKVSQVIKNLPDVDKVMFVVDRKDLDYQTAKEFNAFSEGCVDTTTNTSTLIKQINSPDNKLIVTTLQKLNNAVMNERYLSQIEHLRDKKVVFIFDECHRSQFGATHQNIKKFFNNAQMFGFTGTPIFDVNVNKSAGMPQTTKDLFEECLHKYVIVDAIRDQNVLKFSVEYVGKYQDKPSNNEMDIATDVEEVFNEQPETKATLEDERRLEKIAEYILNQHGKKTSHRQFNAMFCVSNVATLIRYYQIFKRLQDERAQQNTAYRPLKIATIFSFAANEEDPNKVTLNGQLADEDPDISAVSRIDKTSRDQLDAFIQDYNQQFLTKFSTNDSKSFYDYYKDIAKRVKEHAKRPPEQQVDILLVVNMFLTGFDAKTLNTLYVDKNLQFHGLVQAFSRTNRIYNANKSHGNIVCFRNLKSNADAAITLFSNTNANETVFVKPYEEYLQDYETAVAALIGITPTPQSVDKLDNEEEQLEFIKAFRDLLRLQSILKSFADFETEELALDEQTFEDFQSKYLDLHDRVKKPTSTGGEDKPSILDEVDFETELIQTDLINVAYIQNLLKGLCDEDRSDWIDGQEVFMQKAKSILDMAATDPKLRVKIPLLQKFVETTLPNIHSSEQFDDAYAQFWDEEKLQAANDLVAEEHLKNDSFLDLIENFAFSNQLPREDEIAKALDFVPKISERKKTIARVKAKVEEYIGQFVEDAV